MNATQEVLDAISDFENGRISAGEYKKILDKFRDVEPVVRCKDCQFKECVTRFGDIVCDRDGTPHRPEWYCPVGERETDEG